MEAINDSTRLVAQAIKILKEFNGQDWYEQLDESIALLETALERLATKIF